MFHITSVLRKGTLCIFLCIIFSFFQSCTSAAVKAQRKAYNEQVYKAKTVRYRCPYKEAWSALYSVIAERFQIMRESESRGYIETDWTQIEGKKYPGYEPKRVKVSAEITGDSLYRITMRCPSQKKELKKVPDTTDYEYTGNWIDTEDNKKFADDLYYKLYDRLKDYVVE